MSGAIMNKVWDLFGMDTAEDKEENEYEYEDYEQEQEEVEEKRTWGKRNTKLLSLPQAQQVKMVISQPTTFEQSESICSQLSLRRRSFRVRRKGYRACRSVPQYAGVYGIPYRRRAVGCGSLCETGETSQRSGFRQHIGYQLPPGICLRQLFRVLPETVGLREAGRR